MRRIFFGFVRKEFYHILRDRRTLAVLFGMPLIMMALFGFAIRNEIDDVPLLVVDASRDEATDGVVDRLRASGYFDVVEFGAGRRNVEAAFERGDALAALAFEPDFARRLRRGEAHVQVITDATNPNAASTVLAYTTAVLNDVQSEQALERGMIVAADGSDGTGRVVPSVRMRYNPDLESAYLFVPGLIAVILMLVCALMTSITITRERETGTMEVLLVSPLHPLQIIAGKVLPYLALSLVNVATILVLAVALFHVPVRGSLALLLAECLLFILCALSLGMLISARSRSMQTATMIALAGLLMPTVLLSGFIFPISSMPEALQLFSHLIPAKWFLIVVRGIMIRGIGLEVVWMETLVLVGMTAVFMTVAVRSFSIRLE
ncbi:MAG: ABC transporter permease [Rhodothermales bacterium]